MNLRNLNAAIIIVLLTFSHLQGWAGPRAESRSGTQRWAEGVVIVKLRQGASMASLREELTGGRQPVESAIVLGREERLFPQVTEDARAFGLDRIYRVFLNAPYSEPYVAKALSQLPAVEYAEPDYVARIHTEPNDSLYHLQWYLPEIHAPEGWDIERGSSEVIIAIVDTGVDMDHPDLASKIWTNVDEVAGNGFDDDHNGFVDDVHGWDFVNNNGDPNPDPDGQDNDGSGTADDGTDHGTEMAGLAGAATNNGKGIASTGWHCTIMPLKALDDEGSGFFSDLTEAIRYAIDNGADIVNMSFGGPDRSQSQEDVIEYGLSRNVVFVAAAGNSSSDAPHYPSDYKGVLSVTGTGFNGRLSSISNYGPAVDLAAPGGDFNADPPAEIWSTVAYFPQYGFNDYYRARTKEGFRQAGTSTSSALVSGVAGLVLTRFPGLGWLDVQRRIVATCDNIDAVNPGFEGKLGGGLVNVYRALAEEAPPPVPPRIVLQHFTMTDATFGDGDALYEHGEIIAVSATYRNYSVGYGRDVVISLSSEDPGIEVVQGTQLIPELPPDSTVRMSNPLTFRIRPDAQGHVGKIVLTHTAGTTVGSDTLLVTVGKTPVLVVDDDHEGGDGTDFEIERYTTLVLDRLGVNYSVWDIERSGHPSGAFLKHFPTVIWLCEWAFPSLEMSDRVALQQFLDNGGSLFLSGQDIGWDLNDQGSDNASANSRAFFRQYLHAEYVSDDAEDHQVFGIPGDPISDQLDFRIYQPGRVEEYQFPDVIEPLGNARTIFRYSNGSSGAICYSGDHRVVYFGFGFEAVDASQNTPPDAESPIRNEVMARVLEWLSSISHEPLSDTEDFNSPRDVLVQLTGDVSDLTGVWLYWKKAREDSYRREEMILAGERLYVATIPAPGEPIEIEYYIQTDNPYFSLRKPTNAPDRVFSFYAGPDTLAPVIQHAGLPNTINGEEPFAVVATVEDNSAVDGQSVYVHFFGGASVDSVQLRRSGLPTQFTGAIPAEFDYGDTVSYCITARDSSSRRNLARSDTFTFVVGLEDFEDGIGQWEAPAGGWGLETLYAHSGEHSVNDSPGEQYPNNANVSLQTRFGFDFSGSNTATLSFWTKYFLEADRDYGYVELSADGGRTWQQVGQAFTGVQTSWQQVEIPLKAFTGPGFTDVRLRFRMQSDATQVPPFFGWFIDDVQVVEGVELSIAAGVGVTVPTTTALHPNYPNPFNPTTTIIYDLVESGEVKLEVYNLLGQKVRTLVEGRQVVGSHRVVWDALDDAGRTLAGGVYVLRLYAGRTRVTRKIVLLK